jgi:long-subunit fatty acid transport protein
MRVRNSIVSGAAALAIFPASATAGGLVLPGSGPVSTGRAGASVASIDDGSALGVNPAGLSRAKGTQIHIGTSLIAFHQTMARDGSYEDVPEADLAWEGQRYGSVSDDSKPVIGVGPFQAVPVIAVSSDLGGKVKGLVIAAGVFAPNAYPVRSMGADYEFNDPNTPPPPTRYDTVEQKAAVVLPSIAASWNPTFLPKLRVGGRFSFGFADLEARTYVWGGTNYREWTEKEGEFAVKVKDSFVPAWGLGLQYAITPSIEVGAQYSSPIHVGAKGTGTSRVGDQAVSDDAPVTVIPTDEAFPGTTDLFCEPAGGGTRDALKACVNLSLPQMATVGGRYIFRDGDGREMADIELNVQWENWGGKVSTDEGERNIGDYQVIVDGYASISFPPNINGLPLQSTLIRHNLKDTFSVRLGGSYQRDVGKNRLTLRGGAAHDTVAAKEGWQRVDFDGAARTTVAAGASFTMSRVRIDVGVGKVFEGSRTQGTGCNPDLADTGCGPGGMEIEDIEDRTGPDPVQPTVQPNAQFESPFTTGTITSGYNLLMLGVTTWF